MFLKNKNIIFKIRRSKFTDYAALNKSSDVEAIIMSSMGSTDFFFTSTLSMLLLRTRAESPTPICLWCYKLRRLFKSSVVINQTQKQVLIIPDPK